MKPEYEAFKKTLIAEQRKRILNQEELSDRDILRGQCRLFSTTFQIKFPHLRLERGFYNYGGYNCEHIWCVDVDGTIVDPTVEQFLLTNGTYKVFDPKKDQILIGKCCNCGIEIYGLEEEGPRQICSEVCERDYTAYVEREARRF